MTPSGWHDDARNRDAGHDEMQIGAWKWLRDFGSQHIQVQRSYNNGIDVYDRRSIAVEKPFIAEGGKIVCFADIAEIFVFDEPAPHRAGHHNRKFYYRAFEVKPKIYSVGALLRQCAALEEQVKAWRPDRSSFDTHKVWVVPLVMADDEKLLLLQEVARCVAMWDGEKVCWWKAPAQ